MNGRRSRLEIEAHNRANKELADDNIGHWVPCVHDLLIEADQLRGMSA